MMLTARSGLPRALRSAASGSGRQAQCSYQSIGRLTSIWSQVIAHSSNLRCVISTWVLPKLRITGPSAK
jgi:hypothetical protein